jgi:hypothetical protein
VGCVQMVFLREKAKSSPYFEGKRSQKSPYLDNEFLEITRTKWGSKLLIFSFPVWLLAKFSSSLLWGNWKKTPRLSSFNTNDAKFGNFQCSTR